MDDQTENRIIKVACQIEALEKLFVIVVSQLIEDKETMQSILANIPDLALIKAADASVRPAHLPAFLQEGAPDKIFVEVLERVFEDFKRNLPKVVAVALAQRAARNT